MYSSDGQSVQPISSKSSKPQSLYTKPSSAASMETHWEEAIQCVRPEKKWDKSKKISEISIDGDDTESELIVIPESDLSDSTLHGSVQDSFDEALDETSCSLPIKNEKVNAIVKIHEPLETATKMSKDVFISQIIRTPTTKRPTWIIGSEDESTKGWDNKNYMLHDNSLLNNQQRLNSLSKKCSKLTPIDTGTLANTVTVVTNVHINNNTKGNHKNGNEIIKSANDSCKSDTYRNAGDTIKTLTDNNQSHKLLSNKTINISDTYRNLDVQKCSIIDTHPNNTFYSVDSNFPRADEQSKAQHLEPLQYDTPPDCEDCFKNTESQLILAAPSFERLLPIGASRSTMLKSSTHVFEDNLQSPDSPLSKMDVMILGKTIIYFESFCQNAQKMYIFF